MNNVKPIPIEEAILLYQYGWSPRKIAEKYATTDNTVRSRLRKHGVRLRTLSESQSIWQKGFPKTEEHKRKLSLSKMGKPAPKPPGFGKHVSVLMKGKRGAKHPSWRGGVTPIRNSIMKLPQYREWRNAVYSRDGYKCQMCGKLGGDLNAHHNKRVMEIIREYNIETIEQAERCALLWDVSNGIALCKPCHSKMESAQWLPRSPRSD